MINFKSIFSVTKIILSIVILFIAYVLYNTYERSHSKQFMLDPNITQNHNYKKIILAGGCFWCTESEFNHLKGVVSAVSGYASSDKENPTYEEVSGGQVKAREAVQVIYDPNEINIDELLSKYFMHIDPTDGGGQFADRGFQYTSAIYYTDENQKQEAITLIDRIDNSGKFVDKVATLLLPFDNFYPAEEYHQDYKDKNTVRYNLYREGSGRNQYIRLHWQDGSTTTREIFENLSLATTSASTTATSSTSTVSNVRPWENFTQEMKANKLKELTEIQRSVTQEEGTEKPFSNEYNANKSKGIYVDILSGEPLFLSSDKYESGTGWPSFTRPISESAVATKTDNYLIYSRTEVRSKIADSHLGHVFDDGPKEDGGKRYCMNSAALRFIPIQDMPKEGYGEFVDLIK